VADGGVAPGRSYAVPAKAIRRLRCCGALYQEPHRADIDRRQRLEFRPAIGWSSRLTWLLQRVWWVLTGVDARPTPHLRQQPDCPHRASAPEALSGRLAFCQPVGKVRTPMLVSSNHPVTAILRAPVEDRVPARYRSREATAASLRSALRTLRTRRSLRRPSDSAKSKTSPQKVVLYAMTWRDPPSTARPHRPLFVRWIQRERRRYSTVILQAPMSLERQLGSLRA
jgi:hypothetical protein